MTEVRKSLISYRETHGLSQKQLGLKMGMSEVSIKQIEDGRRPVPHKLKQFHAFNRSSQIQNQYSPRSRPAFFNTHRRDLPVLGRAQGGNDGNMIMNDTAIDWTFRPADLQGVDDAFAVFVTGDSMVPKYSEGDLVYVHPSRRPRRNRFVLVEQRGHRGFIKQFIKWQEQELVLRQFNPEKEIRIPATEVLHVKLIIGSLDK